MKADMTGLAVSSTRIRESLRKGSLQEANTLLGYHHYLSLHSDMVIRPSTSRSYTKIVCSLAQKEIMPTGIYSIAIKQSTLPFARGYAELSDDQRQLILYLRQPDGFQLAHGDKSQIIFFDFLGTTDKNYSCEEWLANSMNIPTGSNGMSSLPHLE